MTEDAVSPTPPSTPPSRVMLEHPFWRFSLAVYGRAGVAETVLNFQDRRGAQVNVILFVLWLTAMGQDVSDILLSRAISVSRDWQESVVGPVRRARRAVQGDGGPLFAPQRDGTWRVSTPSRWRLPPSCVFPMAAGVLRRGLAVI